MFELQASYGLRAAVDKVGYGFFGFVFGHNADIKEVVAFAMDLKV